jgi:hypothetical protein
MWKNNIIKRALFIIMLLMILVNTHAQTGLNFQGVARTSNNVILASQAITIKLSILQGSSTGTADYVETRRVITNAQGLFTAVIGDTGAISSLGNFTNINWKNTPKFLKIEMDAAAGTNFITMGTTQFQYVAYAQFAKSVDAENIVGIVPVTLGGTGVNSLTGLKTALTLNNVNNTSDLSKPISTLTQTALDLKLNAADSSKFTKQTYSDSALLTKLKISDTAVMLSSRIARDTLNLSNRINLKANTTDVTSGLDLKLNKADTIKFTKQTYSDSALLTKLKISDTTAMLSSRIARDTLNLSNRINLKANTTDITTSLSLKENISNKSTAVDLGGTSPSDVLFPTQKAVKEYIAANNAGGGVADGGITNSKLAEAAVTNDKIASGIDKAKVGLGNVDNSADSLKPISIPVQAALDSKASSSELRSFVKIDTVNRFISEQLFDGGLTTASLTLGGGTRIESGINSETTLFNRSGADFIINTTAISGNDTPTSSSWIFKSDGALSFDNLFSLKFDPIVEEFNLTSEKNIGLVSNNDSLRLNADKEISILGNQSVGIRSFNNVFIGTGLIQDGGQILPKNLWRFDEEGNLELPNETKIETGTITETVIRNRPNSDFIINTTAISGNNTPTSSSWEFSPSGTLTLPDNSTIGTNDSVFSIVSQNGIYFNGGGVQNESGRWGEIFISPIQSRGNVFITSTREGNTASPTTSYWSFGASVFDSTINSILTFPDGSEIGPIPYPLDDSIDPVFGIKGVNGIVLTGSQEMGSSNLAIIGISPSYWFNNNFEIDTVDTHGNFYIATSYLDDDEDTQVVNNWKFGNDGILTFPDGTTLAGNYSGSTDFELNISEGAGFKITTTQAQTWDFDWEGSLIFPDGTTASSNEFDNSDFGFQTDNKGFTIGTYTYERGPNEFFYWNYSKVGVLTFPDGTITSGNISSTSNFGFDTRNAESGFSIITSGTSSGTSQLWSYNTDGSLTFPDGTITSGSISGTSNFGFDTRASESNFSIITGTSTSTAQWTFGTDGVLNLPAGGDIKIGGNSVLSLRDNFFSEEFQIDDGTYNFSEDYGYKFATNIDFKFTDVDNNNVIYWKIPISKMPISNGHKSVYIDGVKLSNNHFFVTSSHLFIETEDISPRNSPLGYYRINIDYQY